MQPEQTDLKRKYEEAGKPSGMELAIVTDLHPATISRALNGGKVSRKTIRRMWRGLDTFPKSGSKAVG